MCTNLYPNLSGFLSLGTSEAPGNAGLKDHVFALKWVQSEIGKFGGDMNRVTLGGCSSGSISVHLLYLSPLAKGKRPRESLKCDLRFTGIIIIFVFGCLAH